MASGQVTLKCIDPFTGSKRKQAKTAAFSGFDFRHRKISPRFYRGKKKSFSREKNGELKASRKELEKNKTSKYNSSGLATALLKYKEV